MNAPGTTSPPPSPAGFEHDARQAIERVRAALGAVLAAIPGSAPLRRPTDLAIALPVDKTLAWKIVRCVQAEDPFAAARLLPGEAGVETFLKAAAKAGVAAETQSAVTESLRAYRHLMHQHGGNRRTFQQLLESLSENDRDEAEQAHRKAAFEANSFIFGVKTRAQLALRIVHPSDAGDTVDVVAVAGFIDLVRIRPEASWIIARSAYAADDGALQAKINREPIDEAAPGDQAGAPLLHSFCSSPLPELTREVAPDGFLETTLPPGPIGETAAATLVTGEVLRRVAPSYSAAPGETADFISHLRTPAEWFIDVILVHRELFAPAPPPVFGLYSELSSTIRRAGDCRPQERVCSAETLHRLSSPVVWSHHVPTLGPLVEHIVRRLSWTLESFDVFQAQVPFPVVRSASVVSFPLKVR